MTVERLRKPEGEKQTSEVKSEVKEEETKREKLLELGIQEEEAIKELSTHLKIETLIRKIESLEKTGFKEPVEAIEKHPSLASLNIEKVKRKIEFLERVIKRFNLENISAIEIGKNFPVLFGYQHERIRFYLYILRELARGGFSSEKLVTTGKELVMKNPYLVFSFMEEIKPENFQQLGGIFRTMRALNKLDKSNRIKEVEENLPKKIEELKKSDKEYDRFLAKLGHILELSHKRKKRKK